MFQNTMKATDEWFAVQKRILLSNDNEGTNLPSSSSHPQNCEICGGELNPAYKETFCKCQRRLLNVAWKIYDLASDFHELKDQLDQLSLKDRVELESDILDDTTRQATTTTTTTTATHLRAKRETAKAPSSISSDAPSTSLTTASQESIDHYYSKQRHRIPSPLQPPKRNSPVIAKEASRSRPNTLSLKLPLPPSRCKPHDDGHKRPSSAAALPMCWSPRQEKECYNIDGYIWTEPKSLRSTSSQSDICSLTNSCDQSTDARYGYIKTPPIRLELSSNSSYVAPLNEHHVVFLPNNRTRTRSSFN